MNENLPPLAPVESAAPAYKDRSNGLIIFGILTILLGGLCGLLTLFMLAGFAVGARTTQVSGNFAGLVPGLIIYISLAVALVWLGIGSIQARRWARALLLIFSWSSLVMGVISLGWMAVVMPKIMANIQVANPNQPALPSGVAGVMMIISFLFMGLFLIVIPAGWIFFYNSRHVKATCEARDPAPGWTDACPLPVLALSLWLLCTGVMMLIMSLSAHGVIPLFGIFLAGVPGMLLYLAIAAVWCYAAWLVYQVKPLGWWLILVGLIVFMTSAGVTFAQHDVVEMYQLMGYPEAQIALIQQTGLLAGNHMLWLTLVSCIPWMAYILFVKRYFKRQDQDV